MESELKDLDIYPFNYKGEKVIDGNCVVIRYSNPYLNFLCGYVVYRPSEIPSDWYGNIHATGLQFLSIHGGITFAESYSCDKEAMEKIELKFSLDRQTFSDMAKANPKWDGYMNGFIEAFEERRKARASLPLDAVVFGFDCGHAGDESNPLLNDFNHVMSLTKQMDKQMRMFAKAYDYYIGSDEEERMEIITSIRNNAEHELEIGFGAIIEILKNNSNKQ